MSAMSLDETLTRYMGRRERVAMVYVGGKATNLGLAGTARCAASLEDSKATAENLYRAAGVAFEDMAGMQLRDYCRSLTGWKERAPRY